MLLLLPLRNPIKYHEEVLSLQPMIPPKRFDIFPPDAQKVSMRSDFSLNNNSDNIAAICISIANNTSNNIASPAMAGQRCGTLPKHCLQETTLRAILSLRVPSNL